MRPDKNSSGTLVIDQSEFCQWPRNRKLHKTLSFGRKTHIKEKYTKLYQVPIQPST